jgi:hypothetical protein
MLDQFDLRIRDVSEICRRFGVERLHVFGSTVSGDFSEESSDLDFLVDFNSPDEPGLADRCFGLLEALERLFGRPVDLVVTRAIDNPYFRKSVENTRKLLYAA